MSKSVSEVRAATRQKQLLAEKVETQEYVANLLANARSHKRFKPIDVLGQGTYGKVYKAFDQDNPDRPPVAMKKVRRDARRGYSVTVMREISLMLELKHPNIVALEEICTYGNDGLFLVMTAMEIDLLSLYYSKINGRRCVQESSAKWFVRQLLDALAYCHKHNVVHRDVKSSNIFVNFEGELRLGDFGLARKLLHDPNAARPKRKGKNNGDKNEDDSDNEDELSFEDGDDSFEDDELFDTDPMYTNRVVTLWYRAPELLLGATFYGPEIDVWAVGCIIAELLSATPLYPGRSEYDELQLIAASLGAPPKAVWPKGYAAMRRSTLPLGLARHSTLAQHPVALDLCSRLLRLVPSERLTCQQALDHMWFNDSVVAQAPSPSFYQVPSLMTRLTSSAEGKRRSALDRSWKQVFLFF